MTVPEYAVPDLPRVARDLFSDRCIIAITPETDDSAWATRTAWAIARAAAATGRRTALIDLNLENPSLHVEAKEPQDTGIVDAFSFGASLQHVVSRDDDPNLFFIGVGTPPADTAEVMGSTRWQRLSRGFGREEAILVLFLPPAGLDEISLTPDLVVAIAPEGFGTHGPRSPQLRSAVDRGTLLISICEPQVGHPEAPSGAGGRTTGAGEVKTTPKRRSGTSRKILIPFLGVAVTAFVAAAVLWLTGAEAPQSPTEPQPEPKQQALESPTQATVAAAETMADTAGITDSVAPSLVVPAPPADTLWYSIQVAAWARLSRAFAHFTDLTRAGVTAMVSAVPRDSSRVWYRVLVGAVPDRTSARELRQSLRDARTIAPDRGFLMNTPYALLLATHPDRESGDRALRGLRESGVPAYIVTMPDSSVQILVGAFESREQAELADSLFPETERGLSKVLITRTGIAR